MGLLEGKVGIVTGAAAGIGRATALMFAREGAKVTVADRNAREGEETVALITAAGGEALFTHTDVARPQQVAAMVERTVARFGGLHCASNNAAAGGGYGLTADLSEKAWDLALAVTLKGVWLCMKHEIPAMLESGGGSIVNIGSASGIKGEAFLSAYSAAKGGVNTLTKTAAAEYAERGIRVNAVCPGGVLTAGSAGYFEHDPELGQRAIDSHAMKRLGRPEEIADAVTWLCSDRSSFATGQIMVVDGGALVKSHAL
jgi:NAD(P)-dependent dehydrogenase (short-subunit alcohol dehydrogenase family)